jgi:hypothetical protein
VYFREQEMNKRVPDCGDGEEVRHQFNSNLFLCAGPHLSHITSQIRAQFHQRSMDSFCACRSQKRKNTVKSSVSFYVFGIYKQKSCAYNIDEIEPWCQFHQPFLCSFYTRGSKKRKMILTIWLRSDAFRICARKSCSYNVDEIDPRRRRERKKMSIFWFEQKDFWTNVLNQPDLLIFYFRLQNLKKYLKELVVFVMFNILSYWK